MADVAVIGAGAGDGRWAPPSAWCARVTIFEREEQAGGLTAGFKVGANWLDKFYHHIFRTDRRMIGLFDERAWGTAFNGAVRPQPSCETDRSAALMARWKSSNSVPCHSPPGPPGSGRSSAEGCTRPGALRGHDCRTLVASLDGPRSVRGDLGAAAAGQVRCPCRADQHAVVLGMHDDRMLQLGYPRGGFQVLYEALADDLRQRGSRLEFGCSVQEIRRRGDKVIVTTSRGEESFDAVLCSLPTRLFLRLTRDLPQEYATQFSRTGREHFSATWPDPGVRPQTPGCVLGERRRSWLPVRGTRRAYKLDASIRLRRKPPRVPRQLSAPG